jgi:4'-phosphopantetheinyl transferase
MDAESLSALSREVHVWYARPDRLVHSEQHDRYRAMLSADETTRQNRFVFAKDRHLYLVSRAVVRATLSRYADVDPAAWVFSTNAHGKPDIAHPVRLPPLRFNLSHCDGLVALAVTLDCDVGIDAENIGRPVPVLDLARRCFSPAEAAELARWPARRQRERFYDYWTLKEAYIKARGMGLSIPLDGFSMHPTPQNRIEITFAPGVQDDPAHWQFAQFTPTKEHKIALAIRRAPGEDLPVVLRETRP